jgi:hypothetical protein
MAMAAAPAVAHFFESVGFEQALRYTLDMSRICSGPNPDLPITNLDFSGAPTGIDIRKVTATGILPLINTGIAHRLAGVGQVGAGIVTPPLEVFHDALRAFHGQLHATAAQ